MNVQDRADEIARKAIAASGKYRLRQPASEDAEKSKTECIAQLVVFYKKNLTLSEACLHAASTTYRAVEAEVEAKRLSAQISKMLDALDLAEAASSGSVQESRQALAKLAEQRNTLISMAVAFGQLINTKQKASAAGKQRQVPSATIKAFAIEQFEQGRWKSINQAAQALWPSVQAKAKQIGWIMSETGGLKTLYRWLLDHKKHTPSAS